MKYETTAVIYYVYLSWFWWLTGLSFGGSQVPSSGCCETRMMLESSQSLPHSHVWHWDWESSNCWGLNNQDSSDSVFKWSLQHGGFRAAEFTITWLLRAPQANVLREETRYKLCHLLRSSLESRIGLCLLCKVKRPPKKPIQIQRKGTEMSSLNGGEGRVLKSIWDWIYCCN